MSARTLFVGFLFAFAAFGFYLAFTVKSLAANAAARKDGVSAPVVPSGADGNVPVPPLPDAVDEKNNAGLLLELESLAQPGVKDFRVARIPNLFVPAGTPPSAFLPAGPFKATWDGFLKVDLRDNYVFTADGRGKLKVEIFKLDPATKNEPPEKKKYTRVEILSASGSDFKKTAGKPQELAKGKNRFIITYESPADGDAIMRLNWRSAEIDPDNGFFDESLPPRFLTFDNSNPDFRAALRLRQGRELYASLRCEACHGGEHIGAKIAKEFMPELSMDAPNLSEAGRRLKRDWIAHWVKNPRALRNESSMPALLRGANLDADAADIAEFLSTLGTPEKADIDAPNDESIKKGGYVFAKLGCISCHMLPNTQKADPGRILLSYVRNKWNPPALQRFLRKPDAHYAWIRMPDFRLTDDEIKHVSAFILGLPIKDGAKGETIPALEGKGDAAHGKMLVESLGCLNCHNAGDKLASQSKAVDFKSIKGEKWAQGCLADKEKSMGKAPNFHLSAEERGALLAFAATDLTSLKQEALPEFAERQIASLRCIACHNRDGKEALWSEQSPLEVEQADFKEVEEAKPGADPGADEKKVGQHKPSLTWIGEKLKPEWMTKFIDGKIEYKPRIWLHARMPGFHSRADLLSKGLCIEHGYATVNPPEFKRDEKLAEIGARIAAKDGGFNCAACHKIGGENVTTKEAFEWPAINFMFIKERLMEPFYYKWMHEPIRMEPGTGMTAFAKGGKNPSDFFKGDGEKQIEALWHYLQAGREIKSPNPD